MTVLEVPTNGNAKEAARQDALAGMSRADIAAKYGMSDGWAGGVIRDSGRTRGRSVAAGAVPGVGADGNHEAPSLARTNKSRERIAELEEALQATSEALQAASFAKRGPVDWAIIAIVAAVGALWSYSHVVDLAILAGHGWRSYLVPIAIDGLAIAGIRAVGRDRRYPVAWLAIIIGIIGTVTANVLAVRPELVNLADVAAVLAAFPPIALAVTVHLVRR